jgi:hypothetical protein
VLGVSSLTKRPNCAQVHLDPQESDVHFPELCSTYGINRTYEAIAPLIDRFGPDVAMIKLQAFARTV